MTAGAKSCTYCIYIFCHANCCYCFFLCFFFFYQLSHLHHLYRNILNALGILSVANTVIYLISETLSEMKLVCPIVQDFYFPKLKICYKKKSSCLPSSFHECSLLFNGIIISGGIFAFSICHNIVKTN